MRASNSFLVACIILGLLMCAHSVWAAMMSPAERLEQFEVNLKLSSEQKAKVKPVLEETSKRFHGLPDPKGLSGEQLKERGKQVGIILGDEKEKLKKILSQEQFEKYQQLPLQVKATSPKK